MTKAEPNRAIRTLSEERAFRFLAVPRSCTELGELMWPTGRRQTNRQCYARPAGKIIRRLLERGLVKRVPRYFVFEKISGPMRYVRVEGAAEVHSMAREIIQRFHPDLKDRPDHEGSGIRLCILFASNGDGSGDAPVKCQGYPAQAVVSVIPYLQRVDKRADAQIIIDESNWHDLTEPQQWALLDHEITHLEVQKDKHGFVQTDDAGRPKIKLRLHDFVVLPKEAAKEEKMFT